TLHLQGSTVVSLVDVLVDIFDRLDGCTDLQVNMTLKLHQQLRRIWNNIFVGKDGCSVISTSARLLDSVAIIRSCILWIPIFLHASLLTKVLGKALLAESIDYTTICSA